MSAPATSLELGVPPLRWERLRLVMENVRNVHGREHPLFVLRSILLYARRLGGRALEEPEGWTFRPAGALAGRVRVGGRYEVLVVLPPGAPAGLGAQLGENVAAWLGDGGEGRNFRLAQVPEVQEMTLAGLLGASVSAEAERAPHHAAPIPEAAEQEGTVEWCLDFQTPLALRSGVDGAAWGSAAFWRSLESRLEPLGFGPALAAARLSLLSVLGLEFGLEPVLGGEGSGLKAELQPVEVRPWFLERVKWGHSQKHGPQRAPSREDLGGWLGPLYLRGTPAAMAALRPVLCLAEEFHLGKGLHRGQGAAQLRERHGFFDARLGSHTSYFAAFEAVREETEADPVLHAGGPAAEAAASLHSLHDKETWCRDLAAELRRGAYQPAPPRLVNLVKKDGGTRTLSLLHDRDRVAQRALLQMVGPMLDRQLETASHAWRAGRGVESARRLVAQAFREGLTWVVESDIAAFFDEIPHERLDAALDRALPRADVKTRAALRACYAAPHRRPLQPPGELADAPPAAARGILQGSPLSPLLANLLLDTFDEALAAQGHRLVRYGDDFLILCPSPEAAAQALRDAATALASLGLRLREDKTALTSFQAGFFFLGREFGSGMDEAAAEAATLRRTLFIHTPGAWAGQDHDSLIVKKDKALLARVPLERVSDVVFMGAQGVSTWLLQTCARRRIPVTLANAQGWHVQTLVPDSRAHWDLAARQATRHATLGPDGILRQARRIVEAKLTNHLAWLAGLPGGAHADPARAAAHAALTSGLHRLPAAPSVESLRGTEGQAAAALFPVVNRLALNPAFHSTRRAAREKHDLWNTLYDAASSLLFSRLNLLLRSRGVNPYLGFLHSAADRYESLVCDLQEPFRARLDRFLLKLVNKRSLTPEHFLHDTPKKQPAAPAPAAAPAEDLPLPSPGPLKYKLSPEGYRRLLDAWDRELRTRLAGDPATLGDLLASQVWLTVEYIQKHLPWLQLYHAVLHDKEHPADTPT